METTQIPLYTGRFSVAWILQALNWRSAARRLCYPDLELRALAEASRCFVNARLVAQIPGGAR